MSSANMFQLSKNLMQVVAQCKSCNIDLSESYVEIWKQIWSSTSCGFPGHGGQAFTEAYTILVFDSESSEHFVFIDGKLAYKVGRKPNQAFYDAYQRRDLMGSVAFCKAIDNVGNPYED